MENHQFLFHDNAPGHRCVLIKDFLAKKNVTTLENSSFFNLAPNDFYFFPVLESAFKRRRFFEATDIIKNAAEELKRF
jgi:hypothetical protein